jgi:hypothetical protein
LSDFRGLLAESLTGFLREVLQGLFSLGGFDRLLDVFLGCSALFLRGHDDFLLEIRAGRACAIVDGEQSMAADAAMLMTNSLAIPSGPHRHFAERDDLAFAQ